MGRGNTARTSNGRPRAPAPPPSRRSASETANSWRSREDRHRRLDDVQPLRLRRGTAGGPGDRRGSGSPGMASRGTTSIATSTGSSRPRGPRVPVPLEMRAVGRCTPAAAGNRQRLADGPAHPSRHGRRRQRVHLHRRDGGPARVRITHRWVERSASRPPEAPTEPVFPRAGGDTEGTAIVFQWRPASDPDGDAIADYHFELSGRADMKWPLSMSFAKLISRTADAGRPRYTLPGPGLLNPDTAYFWQSGARMARGSGAPGAPPGASRRGDRHLRGMFASNTTAGATGASSAGRPTRGAASPWPTAFMPATRRAFRSATGPTRSRWESPEAALRSSPRTSWSRPRPPSWRWWAPA